MTKLLPLDAIKERFLAIAKRLGAENASQYFRFVREDNGGAHCELDYGTYHYIYTERGKTIDQISTEDPDELLFFLTRDLTRDMASKHELSNRPKGRCYPDPRRANFAKHVELMEQSMPDWGKRVQKRYDEILKIHPFEDRT